MHTSHTICSEGAISYGSEGGSDKILLDSEGASSLCISHFFIRCHLYTIDWTYNNSIIAYESNLCHCNISFDTDSSFWVCNNSVTGHICNDKSIFSGELVPSIYIVGAATGSSKPTLMGTVIHRLTYNNGAKHTFTLTHMNYMPKSPVNLLSTRVLSKQFPNENGFDQQGTGITSVFDDHTLFWDHGQFHKTFKTHSSGLPELLFSSGYSQLQSFGTFLQPYYDDTVHWAFCIGI
jgi:hypothetical protein